MYAYGVFLKSGERGEIASLVRILPVPEARRNEISGNDLFYRLTSTAFGRPAGHPYLTYNRSIPDAISIRLFSILRDVNLHLIPVDLYA